MDITLTLTDDEMAAMVADLTSRRPDGTTVVPDIQTIVDFIHYTVVTSAVKRQTQYNQASRIAKLQKAPPSTLVAIDSLLDLEARKG